MSSFLACSKREKDLLASDVVVGKDDVFVHRPTVEKMNLEAPQKSSNYAPHELTAQGSRIAPTVSDFVEGHRKLLGNAQTEKLILELNSAAQINRGPAGVFPSSRLHLDMLLGRDEQITFGDYLKFDEQ